jgi:chromosome segregation ATPase
MADQDINISIKTTADTTGAEAAKVALDGVTKAVPPTSETQAAADAQARLNQASAEYQASLPPAIQDTQDFSQALEDVSEKGDDTADAVNKVDQRVRAIAFAQAAQLAGGLADAMGVVADSLREVDPEAAKTLDSVSELGSGISTVTGAAAQGFAAGGPWGAVAGATIGALGLVFKKFTDDIAEHNKAIAVAAAVQEKLTEKIRDANEAVGANKYAKLGLDTAAAKDQVDALNLSFERQLNLQNELRKLNETRAENAAKIELAQINVAESTGGIGAAEADQRRAEIRANIAELNKQAALAAAEERIRAEQLELDNLSRYQAAVQQKIQDANTQLSILSGQRADLESELKSAKEGGASQAAIGRIQDALDINSGKIGKGTEDLAALEKDLAGIPEKVEAQKATIEAVRQSVDVAKQAIESDFGASQIGTLADEIVSKTREAETQNTAVLNAAKTSVDNTIAAIAQEGGKIPYALEKQQADIVRLLNDAIPNATQTAEISRALTDLRNASAEKDTAFISGLAANLAVTQQTLRQVAELRAAIIRLENTQPQ